MPSLAIGPQTQTAFMTDYSRGDIVLVPFDFSDRSGTKLRPAVVVSTDEYNDRGPDVLVASITGNLDAVHHVGDRSIVDWQQAGLLIPSLFQTKIATIEASLIRRRLGRLTDDDLDRMIEGLREALDLPLMSATG